jgi:hypothetical protein
MQEPPVKRYYPNCADELITDAKGKQWQCRLCNKYKGQNMNIIFTTTLPDSDIIQVPEVLQNLNHYEKSQIALCTVFSQIQKMTNQHTRVF